MANPLAGNSRLNFVTLILIGLILLAFSVGALQVNRQASQIHKIIDQQSPLIFGFENVGPSGQITFIVTCTRLEDASRYVCTSQSQGNTPSTPTPFSTPVR